MMITNDHYKNRDDARWRYDDDVVYVTADDGTVWQIRPGDNGGVQVRSLGADNNDDQICILSNSSNVITLKAVKP